MPGGIHPPLSVIASWPTPNYVDPERRGWSVVVMCAVLWGLAMVILMMRLWARLVLQHNAGLDDLFIVLAMVRTECDLKLAHILNIRRYPQLASPSAYH